MSELIDISVPLTDALPTWPGSTPFALERQLSIDSGSQANASALTMDTHMGTHLDAPLHGLSGGAAIRELTLDRVIGVAFVAEVPADSDRIGAAELEGMSLPAETSRLLLKTGNSSAALYEQAFASSYAALTLDGARWVADRGIKLVGIDYLSIQPMEDSFETHRVLLEADVWILEGLDLSDAEAGEYELICLPLCIPEAEAAPCRAILRRAA